jgi:SAM-dependent methyltransferase
VSFVSDIYGDQYYQQQMVVAAESYFWVAALRAEKLAPYVKPTDDVFEFGVGNGLNLARLKCASRVGSDINPAAMAQARAVGIDVLPEGQEPPKASYDVVICHHVLEHMPDPAATLRMLAGLLRPEGTLLLCVPYEEQARYRRYDPDEKNHHLYSWTPQTVANLIAACGLQIKEAGLNRFGYDRFASDLARRLHLGESGFRLLRRLIHLVRPEREIRVVARFR